MVVADSVAVAKLRDGLFTGTPPCYPMHTVSQAHYSLLLLERARRLGAVRDNDYRYCRARLEARLAELGRRP